MKALKITLTHGKIWTVETSSGVRAQSTTLEGALTDVLPAGADPNNASDLYGALPLVFDGIRDSGGDGNIAHGQASG